MTPPPDRDLAECRRRSIPTADFFDVGHPKPHVKAACAACPVQRQCLAYTIVMDGEKHLTTGYLGGTSSTYRRAHWDELIDELGIRAEVRPRAELLAPLMGLGAR